MPSAVAAARLKSRSVVSPTSLKLPADLKAKIDDLAGKEGLSAHAFMLQTLRAAAELATLREQFSRDAQDALQHMQSTHQGYELDDVRDYFGKLAQYRKGKGPKPRRPALSRID